MKEGDRVIAPDKHDVLRSGVIVDVLSVMYFVTFDNGTDNYIYKVDKRLEKEDNG
jgi:hypothetical protein